MVVLVRDSTTPGSPDGLLRVWSINLERTLRGGSGNSKTDHPHPRQFYHGRCTVPTLTREVDGGVPSFRQPETTPDSRS